MRRIATYGAALALALSAAGEAAARPEPLPTGTGCAFTVVQDPTSPGSWTGEMDSGPVVVGEVPLSVPDPAAYPATVTVVCTLHVYDFDTGEAEQVAVASGSGTGAAFVAPTPVTFSAGSDVIVFGCTTVHVTDARGETVTYYRNSANGMYDTSEECAMAACAAASPDCSYPYALAQWVAEAGIDPIACEALRALAPGAGDLLVIDPDGDTDVAGTWLWDCPPYES